jgi:sterol desaturase/sphingolipid hydroxylase (fatty acid hydroxylase superfamily)
MQAQNPYLALLVPLIAGIAILVEALYIARTKRRAYAWRESAASLCITLGQRVINLVNIGIFAGILITAWEYRLWTVPVNTVWGLAALFLGVEFCYYWQHRYSHECRWFWATHSVHHSPQHFNLSAAYRLGWTGRFTGALLFYVPLTLLGFHPVAIGGALAANLLYQFWLHTELIGKLGWFDQWFNSPSNHRVHHATNPNYLDCNYGGVIMVFDRMFGTYVPESDADAPRYGLVKQLNSHNPFVIAFHEWTAMAKDLITARTLREVYGYLFARPGWRPDGSGLTTAQLQRMHQHTAPSVSSTTLLKE